MTARRATTILTGRLLVTVCLVAGALPALALGQVAYEQVSRLKHERRRAELDLARLLAERGRVTGATARALEAKIDLRVIVHFLYSQASAQANPSLRCLIATRADLLRAGLGELDELVGLVGMWEHDLAGLPAKSNDADVIKKRSVLQARLRGMTLLDDITGKDMPTKLAGSKELDKLLTRVARAIVLMAAPERAGRDRLDLPPAWPERHLADPAGAKARVEPDLDVDRLASDIEASGMSAALRRQMLDALRRVRGGLDDPKQRGAALSLGRLIEANFGVAQTIARTDLVGEATKGRLEQQILTGLLLAGDERTRRLGAKRLDLAARSAGVLARLGKVRLEDGARGKLATVLRRATGHLDSTLYEDRGIRLLTGLEELADLILRLHRKYDDVRVPKPFDRPVEEVRALWLASIDTAIAALAKEDLQAAAAQSKAMARYAVDLDLILSLPEALAQMRKVVPGRWSALRQRLVRAGEALAGQDGQRKAAIGFLRSAVDAASLIARYRALAYDRRLFGGMDKVVGGRMTSLRRMGDSIAKDLVSGLATAKPLSEAPPAPNAPGNPVTPAKTQDMRASLHQLVVLLSAARDLARLGRLDQEVRQLKRWRAWALQSEAVGKMTEILPPRVATAAQQVRAKNPDLAKALEPVGRYAPLVEILVEMGERYGGWLGKAPEGALGVAARLYHDPRRPITPTERAAMRMCLEVNEAGYAEQMGLGAYAGRHLAEARKLLDAALGRKR